MDKVARCAVVPLFISVAVLLYLASAAAVGVLEVRTFSDAEIGTYLIYLMLACFIFLASLRSRNVTVLWGLRRP